MGIAAIVLAMLIYPPFRIYGYGINTNAITETGYALIFDLPYRATLDVSTLMIQWVGVLIVGAIAFLLLKDK